MRPPPQGFGAAPLLAILLAGIAYASLYPFRFAPLPAGTELAEALRAAWNRPPGGRGDLLANLLLYLPLGFLLAALMAGRGVAARLGLAVLGAALLSGAMEAAQLFLPQRTSSVWDLACNAAGALAGAAAALLLGRELPRLPGELRRGLAAEPFAALLVLAWLGWRLYPYVPVLDLQAWRDSLKPLLLAPAVEPFRTARLAVFWLAAAHLAEAVAGRRLGRWLVPALLLGTPAAAIPLAGRVLTLAELVAAGLALPAWALLRHRPGAMPLLAALMLAAVVASRLEPFAFEAAAKPFGWVPLRGLLQGTREAGLPAMLQKVFLYGGLLWLLVRAGLSLPAAAAAGGLALLAASLAARHLPGRSAEITDALLLLLLAVVFGLLRPRAGGAGMRPSAGDGGQA
ncbi:VanZ family protein [Crenalkalicoccus roseus]|uniref:VanZ family protein n=1 Tax=Crenalkalicoccus roseus TaxID=1485588 RepID=UPI001305145C|nr:VanZ family protein [Crenalkalicoccus roseus]